MDRRVKFSNEEKIKIVKRYLAGEIGGTSLAREVGCHKSVLYKWVYGYKRHGDGYFRDNRKHKSYSLEYKKEAVEYYLKNGSIYLTAAKYCIANSLLRRWIKAYNNGSLKEHIPMPEVYDMKGRRTTFEERKEIVHYCLSHDKKYKETAKVYSLPYSRVYAMVKGYIKEGEVALMNAKERVNARPLTEIEKLQQENERLKEELKFEKLKFDLVQKKIAIENELSREYKKKHHIKR